MPVSLRSPRLRLLGHVGPLPVYLVDGELVRNDIDIDFTCGGNEAVYPNYVPKGEIWIDDALTPLDRTATALHEIVERELMMQKNWSYDRAHDAASARERVFRKELVRDPPRSIDLRRVAIALHAPAPKLTRPHAREAPRVLAVGERRAQAKRTRQIAVDLERAGFRSKVRRAI